jgi:hypothetical protein
VPTVVPATPTPVQVAAVTQAVPTFTRAAPTATPVTSTSGGRLSSWIVYALLFVVGFAGAALFVRSRRKGA